MCHGGSLVRSSRLRRFSWLCKMPGRALKLLASCRSVQELRGSGSSCIDRIILNRLWGCSRLMMRGWMIWKKRSAGCGWKMSIFKKQRLFSPEIKIKEKSALIKVEKGNQSTSWMCQQLGVSRSSFCRWRSRAGTVTKTQACREALKV